MIELAWPFVALAFLGLAAWVADRALKRPGFLEKRLVTVEGRLSAMSLDIDRVKAKEDKSRDFEDRISKLELERGLSE